VASPIKPFLRWAGGKRKLVKQFQKYLPNKELGVYWEPFLGGASLFFFIQPRKAVLSDLNPNLISCYEYVRDKPELVFKYLRTHLKKNSESHYYSVREDFNLHSFSAAQAARFIYLNRTSFNGIYRVNTKGEFNVPYGFKEPPPAPTLDELVEASRVLKRTSLYCLDFENIFSRRKVAKGDFVYLDPPYPPLNSKTAYFTHYTNGRFAWADHVKLAKLAARLSDAGCYVMLSNSNVKKVRDLYKARRWTLSELPVVRLVAANGSRRLVNELIITNYSAFATEGE